MVAILGSTIQTSQIDASRVFHLFLNIPPGSGENWKKRRESQNDPRANCYILYPGANMEQCLAVTLQYKFNFLQLWKVIIICSLNLYYV